LSVEGQSQSQSHLHGGHTGALGTYKQVWKAKTGIITPPFSCFLLFFFLLKGAARPTHWQLQSHWHGGQVLALC